MKIIIAKLLVVCLFIGADFMYFNTGVHKEESVHATIIGKPSPTSILGRTYLDLQTNEGLIFTTPVSQIEYVTNNVKDRVVARVTWLDVHNKDWFQPVDSIIVLITVGVFIILMFV